MISPESARFTESDPVFKSKKIAHRKNLWRFIPPEFKLAMVRTIVASLVQSSCLRMSEIMEHRVTLIENLNRNRQSLPFEAIYFITANEESINRVGIHRRNSLGLRNEAVHTSREKTA